MAALRRLVLIVFVAAVVVAAVVFAYANPGTIALDVGVTRLEQVPIGAAFAVAFACGWAVGLVSGALAMLRGANERRRLRRNLRHAEDEVRTLRDTPLHDAD